VLEVFFDWPRVEMDSAANPRKWAGQRAEHMQNTLLMSHEETVRQQVLYRPIKTSRFLSGFATGGDALTKDCKKQSF
jgi:hypothetical protein